ncbi:class I SAM-dependent methyltransferase [Streptomyces nigrescens]
MTEPVADIGYGRQFDGWYDRLFPDPQAAQETARVLAAIHPDPAAGTCEFGVGTGRIAIPLSRLVGEITGVDSSPEMLNTLAQAALEQDGKVTSVPADIRTFRGRRRFGLVYAVCATLNQVVSREEQQETVRRAADLLVPGGRLVLECHNLPCVEALHEGRARTTLFTPYPDPGTGLQTHSTLDTARGLWQCSHIWYEKDGTTRVGTEYSLLLTPQDTEEYAGFAGLRPVAEGGCYGGWDLSGYTDSSPAFITVYEKPAP